MMARRQTCRDVECPCVEHRTPPKTVQMLSEGVPPLADGPLAGWVYRHLTADGGREVYFLAYRNGRLTRTQLPDPGEVPQSWEPAMARVREFLAAREAVTVP
jgi:hypothetical protein